MAVSDFTIIRHSMTARLFSTITTILTVAVAVALLLVLLSMRDAGRQAFRRGSGNMHLLISRDASPLVSVLNGVFYANPPQRPIEWSKFQDIAARYPLEFAIPTQLGDSYRGFPVMATTPEFFSKFQPDASEPWSLADGRYFQRPFEVVIGATAAKQTGLRAGDRIHLTHGSGASRDASPRDKDDNNDAHRHDHDQDHGHEHVHVDFSYEIVGVLEPTGSAHDRALFTDLASTWIIHAHDRRQRDDHHVTETTEADLLDSDRLITGIYARVLGRDDSDASALLPQTFDQLRRDTSITVASPSQQINTLFTIVSNIDEIFIGMAAVVMVASGIAIMLALYNSMEQRRRQIAVLRVLGCSRSRIFGLIITESAIIGLLGAALGIVLALVGNQIVASIMKQRLNLVIDAAVPPIALFAVVIATIVVASLAGIIPAVMAYRTPVGRNLRPLG